ncbi:MAG: hypothetical protein U0103_21825 [Candidatus Obscuribacterales bacterium]
MMPNFYQLYKADIARHAAKYHAQVVDLFDAKSFTDNDFIDTVHLTGHGSAKLVNKLADLVAPDVASTAIAHRNGKARVAGQEQVCQPGPEGVILRLEANLKLPEDAEFPLKSCRESTHPGLALRLAGPPQPAP